MNSKMRTLSLAPCVLLAFSLAAMCQTAAAADTNDVTGPPAGPQDPGWPRVFTKDGNEVELYQPQVDEWSNHEKIAFRMAVAIQPKGEKEPIYGVLAIKADTIVDNNSRLVLMTNLEPQARFPNIPEAKAEQLKAMMREVLPKKQYLEVSLDRVIAYLDEQKTKLQPMVKLDLNPPPIFRSESPARLIIFMGQPRFKPIKGTRLMFAANTNWDLLLDLNTSRYYLLDGDSWLTAPDPLKGPWSAAGALPADFSKLPADANWEEARKHIPGQPAKSVPKIFASTTPAELIVTEGPPEYTPIAGTKLLYVSNPVMPLFMDSADNSYYYLVAGRWFRAKGLNGPWSAASTDLPADFARIPSDCPVGSVLAAVPNTQQARDATLLASVPHKATINIKDAKADVSYDGEPRFEPIQGTQMKYAVNSPQQVIAANGQYYCCYHGVWFVATAATGPWAVCTSVPAVIYTIPPTSPVYNVTYVKVYDTTPSTVTVGYTGGYTGEYVAATGTLMFGAGMLTGAVLAGNDSWYACGPAYYSYGCGAHYSYGYGGYYRASSNYYGPYGGAGHAATYNSATGTFSRSAYAYGPAGEAHARQAYNPYTGTYAAHAGASNGYQSWGRSYVSQGNKWAEAGHRSGPAGSAGWVETSSGKAAAGASGPGGRAAVTGSGGGEAYRGAGGGAVGKTSSGNVYAGKDGNVYRNEGGQWQHYNNGSWQDASKSSSWSKSGFQNQMNHDQQSRMHGNDLHSRSSEFNRGGGAERGGFRSGGFERGGGFRGGGRRR